MIDKGVWVVPESIDKSVGTETHSKSVRTQYNPLDLINDEIIEKSPVTSVLKVKFTAPKSREKHTNTDLTFPPFAHITFHSEQDIALDQVFSDQAESEVEDFEINIGKTVPLYEPVSSDSETDDDVDHEDFNPTDNNIFFDTNTIPLTEPKILMFWSCLVTLFQFCFTCFKKNTFTKVITCGTLLIVNIRCFNNHKHKWSSQSIIKGSGAGNLFLSASILFSGNSYVRIAEMFNIFNFFKNFIIKSKKQFCSLH